MPSLYPLPHEQIHPEKRRRIGREHGPTSEVALVHVDLVVFGRFEIKPWYPSPYVLDPQEYHQAASTNSSNPPQSISDSHPTITSSKSITNSSIQKTNQNLETNQSSQLDHHQDQRNQKSKDNPSKNISTSPLPLHNNSRSVTIKEEKLTEGSSERSQTPDSLSSIDTGSVPLDFLTNQHPLNIPQNLDPTSSQSLLPSFASDLHPDGSPQLLLPLGNSNNGTHQSDSTLSPSPFLKLYVCDGCLKYLISLDSFRQHKIHCQVTHPPGRKVYQNGKIIIREVDGSKAKLYCQCLCLFGKLFIDHKYIFFDVEGFKFYVLTTEEKLTAGNTSIEMGTTKQKKESIMGFFSKEKISYDGYNLACIVTLPPYQKKGYGTLLIAFSYELDRFEAGGKDENGLPSQDSLYLGTPERPLSTLGAKGYLSFWTAVLVRFFRTMFPPPPPRIHNEFNHKSQTNLGLHQPRNFNSSRPSMMIEMSLEEISRSTRLRPDDAAFALISSGLTKFSKNKRNQNNNNSHHHQNNNKLKPKSDNNNNNNINNQEDDLLEEYYNNKNLKNKQVGEGEGEGDVIIITRDLVEQVAKKSNVKSAVLDPRHILINYTNYDLDLEEGHLSSNPPSSSCSDSHFDPSSSSPPPPL